jgi:curved DNA-binding protein CbpA
MVNFYELLEVNSNATNEEINKGYKKKALNYHPDKNNGSEVATAMFKLLGLAKETLLDAGKRLEHDYAHGIKQRPAPEPRIIKVPVVREVVKFDFAAAAVVAVIAIAVGILIGGGKSFRV